MARLITNTMCSLIVFMFSIFSAAAPTHGGVSGGGGNIMHVDVLDHRQDTELVEHMILNSQTELKKYIQSKKIQFEAGTLTGQSQMIYAKLFRPSATHAKTKVSHVLQNTHLVIKEREPCITPDKELVDGSFLFGDTKSMCISAERFSKKVSYPHIKNEAVALMLHEVGELSGLSEAEAVLIQSQALVDLASSVR